MAARFEPEQNGDGHEMSSLQSGPKPYEGSEGRLHAHEEVRIPGSKQRDQEAAYRKLHGIVAIMAMFLFGLNVVQVGLLPVISSLYWIILFPVIIFLASTVWAAVFSTSNNSLFTARFGSPRQKLSRAFQHLGALFQVTGRSARASERTYLEPSWPRRFERAGIFLAIYLNIILAQFIYLPPFAVPAFQDIT